MGLGRAIALRLASDGAKVAVLDKADATDTVEAIRGQGGEVAAWDCDVTDEEQIVRAVGGAGERFGHIDVLVNNAGILSPRKAWYDWTRAEVQRYLDINFFGYFLVAKAAYPLLKQAEHARIINIA